MTRRVLYSPSVRDDIRDHVRYLRSQVVSEKAIEAWFNDLFTAIDSLAEWSKRYPVDEVKSRQSGFEVRKLTFRRYAVRYRIDEADGVVEVLSFIHGARGRER